MVADNGCVGCFKCFKKCCVKVSQVPYLPYLSLSPYENVSHPAPSDAVRLGVLMRTLEPGDPSKLTSTSMARRAETKGLAAECPTKTWKLCFHIWDVILPIDELIYVGKICGSTMFQCSNLWKHHIFSGTRSRESLIVRWFLQWQKEHQGTSEQRFAGNGTTWYNPTIQQALLGFLAMPSAAFIGRGRHVQIRFSSDLRRHVSHATTTLLESFTFENILIYIYICTYVYIYVYICIHICIHMYTVYICIIYTMWFTCCVYKVYIIVYI